MKNDSVEFSFQDLGLEVVTLEETIRDDEMKFKAKMRNGNQIKEVELRMTISEENNNPPKAEKQEYYEQGTILNPIKLEEDNELNYEEEFDLGEQAMSSDGASGTAVEAVGVGPKQKEDDEDDYEEEEEDSDDGGRQRGRGKS